MNIQSMSREEYKNNHQNDTIWDEVVVQLLKDENIVPPGKRPQQWKSAFMGHSIRIFLVLCKHILIRTKKGTALAMI